MATERKRVFNFYKNICESPDNVDQMRSIFSRLVESYEFTSSFHADLEYNKNALLNESFYIEFDVVEEFYILRNALSDKTIELLYSKCLFDWPYNSITKSNLSLSVEEKDKWIINLAKTICSSRGLEKLRWVTLGYHYDWTNKIYPENCYSPFPSDACLIFKLLSNIVGCLLYKLSLSDLTTNCEKYKEFVPEAAIINYYRKKTNMGFHIDQAEPCKTAPLISISLGRPTIFLLEASRMIPNVQFLHDCNQTLEKDNSSIVPIVLNHGDVMITGGASRLAYHAVPKLLQWDDSIRLSEKFISGLVQRILDESPASTDSFDSQQVEHERSTS